jgi:hypothetical protein
MLHRFPIFNYSAPSKICITADKLAAHSTTASNNVYMAIPKGKKFYAWFTFNNKDNLCVFMNAPPRGGGGAAAAEKQNIICEKVPYSPLCLGTVLYGTMVDYKTRTFVVENIFYFEGRNLENTYIEKTQYIIKIFQTYRNFIPRNFCVARMWRGSIPAELDINKIYRIYCLSGGGDEKPAPAPAPAPAPPSRGGAPQKNTPRATAAAATATAAPPRNQKIFWVKPDIINDIYHLFTAPASGTAAELKYHSIAFIPNYKTSVFMNSIFRKIKENTNLDLLEESDDEEEFENISSDKYVYLDKVVKMYCVYNHKFKKWVPLQTL